MAPDNIREEDFQLLARWIAGDRAAGGALFARCEESLCLYFKRYAPDYVNDLVQDTFIALQKIMPGYNRSYGEFRPYLRGIAHNVLRGHYRSRRRGGEVVALEETSLGGSNSPEDDLMLLQAEKGLIYSALLELDIKDQQLLRLYYWVGCGAAQIAALEGVPVGTIRGRLRLAKDRLNKQMRKVSMRPLPCSNDLQEMEKRFLRLNVVEHEASFQSVD